MQNEPSLCKATGFFPVSVEKKMGVLIFPAEMGKERNKEHFQF